MSCEVQQLIGQVCKSAQICKPDVLEWPSKTTEHDLKEDRDLKGLR